ncbi:MAG: DUF5343 domain-containing protein [Chthoniobacterales bacterium]
MSTKLPYVAQPSAIENILEKVKEAKTPDRFTPDFLTTVLGFKGGNSRQFIPLAKKMGFLNSDGTPTELYKSFRNPRLSKGALGQAIKKAYHEVFERNEYAGNLSKDDFKGLVVEITGLESKDNVVQLVCRTFETLRSKADFDAKAPLSTDKVSEDSHKGENSKEVDESKNHREIDLRLSYTINLVLPKTDDPAVFNAIFRSLRDNLLKK